MNCVAALLGCSLDLVLIVALIRMPLHLSTPLSRRASLSMVTLAYWCISPMEAVLHKLATIPLVGHHLCMILEACGSRFVHLSVAHAVRGVVVVPGRDLFVRISVPAASSVQVAMSRHSHAVSVTIIMFIVHRSATVVIALDHGRPNRFVIIIDRVLNSVPLLQRMTAAKLCILSGGQLRPQLTRLDVVVLLDHVTLAEVCHRRAFDNVIFLSMELCPIIACLLQLCDSLLESLLLSHKFLNFNHAILTSVVFKHHETLTQVFVFVLKLEDLRVLVINELRLLLDGLSESEIALQHFLHHVHRVDDAACDGIFCLIGSIVLWAIARSTTRS